MYLNKIQEVPYSFQTNYCLKCKEDNFYISKCPYFSVCPFKIKNLKKNVIINKFSNFTEVVIYKQDYKYSINNSHTLTPAGNLIRTLNEYISSNDKKFYLDEFGEIKSFNKNGRNWRFNEEGVLIKNKPNVSLLDLGNTIEKSRKRALDNFLGYAFCNEFNYFITLTFSSNNIDRENENLIKNCWFSFRKKLKRIFPDIKILLVIERHKNGCNHFHGLLGNCNLDNYLSPALNNSLQNNGKNYLKPIYNKYGQQVYNFKSIFFPYGFSTVFKLDKKSNKDKMVNYMSKYMTKDSNNIDYQKHTYFRTHNLKFKEKIITDLASEEYRKLFSDNLSKSIIVKKDNEKMKVLIISDIFV